MQNPLSREDPRERPRPRRHSPPALLQKKGDPMALLAAYAVPHPPLIVPAVGRGQEAAIADTIAAYREVARRVAAHRPDLIVITSPHAPLYRDGFFIADTPEETDSLAAFGQPDERVTTRTDLPFAQDVTARLHRRGIPSAGAPASMADIDHATFVPLHFLEETINLDSVTVVRMGLSGLSEADHRFLGRAITEAARALGRRCVLVASGDMSHKLKEDGPYGFAPEGPKFDRTVAEMFAHGNLEGLFGLDAALCDGAAECGLRSFQIMAGALEATGEPFASELLSYEGPFGVGYAVAAFEIEDAPESTEEEAAAREAAESGEPMPEKLSTTEKIKNVFASTPTQTSSVASRAKVYQNPVEEEYETDDEDAEDKNEDADQSENEASESESAKEE